MCETSKEYIQSFIVDINKEINWSYLKSNRSLKKKINDIVFQIDFYSSKYNDINSRVEVRSECRVWCRAYDKSLTIRSGIANIPFLTEWEYWWSILNEDNRSEVLGLLIKEIQIKVIPFVTEMERNYNSGLRKLIYDYGLNAYSNSIQLLDETLGREEALCAANQYADNFTEMEAAILRRYAKGECDLISERNLRYMIVNHFVTI